MRQLEPATRPKPCPAYVGVSKRALDTMDGVEMPTAKREHPSELPDAVEKVLGAAEDVEIAEVPARAR